MTRSIMLGWIIAGWLGSAALAAEPRLPLHPPVPLLDASGQAVLESSQPVSTVTTCAACHDTQYILTHSYHSWVGRNERYPTGEKPPGSEWDSSPGLFGRWDPLQYRYLTQPGDAKLDLGTAQWVQTWGWRHVGGGPAVIGHGDEPLDRRAPRELPANSIDPDRQILDTRTGQPATWDWTASGTAEMNCFLCHLAEPDNEARVRALANGQFQWASTATLASTGLVEPTDSGWKYRRAAFRPTGEAPATVLSLGKPTAKHCGQCHGQVHMDDQPLRVDVSLRAWSTATKGQVFSPQRISQSGANLVGKEQLTRPWDVHAESMLQCRDCHFALNNPAKSLSADGDQSGHLQFEPRRLHLSEYLVRPNHQFAKGDTAQGTVARNLAGTMRSCNGCHRAEVGHDWLPYRDLHLMRLQCEACHIPHSYAPAVEQVDWTLLTLAGEPTVVWRGLAGRQDNPTALLPGYQPILLPYTGADAQRRLAPFNLVAAWYWVEGGSAPRPVRMCDLQAAILDGDKYQASIQQVLDTDKNGQIERSERQLDTPGKVAAVRSRLEAVGVREPRIDAQLRPFGLHHGAAPASWAVRECSSCHADESRTEQTMVVAEHAPGNVLPQLTSETGLMLTGELFINDEGRVILQPRQEDAGFHVLGHDRWRWGNRLGATLFVLILLGVGGHGVLRVFSERRMTNTKPRTKPQ